MKKIRLTAMLAGALIAVATAALASGYYPGFPSAVTPLTGNEFWPADTGAAQGINPATEAITTNQLQSFIGGLAGTSGRRNALIGGDFGQNLWQRGTTSASITTALTYGPDRWWGLSGASTAFTIIKETGASDIVAGTLASARVQRTAAQTGVVATCIGQAVTIQNSIRFQGQTAEFSFHALAGALFSAASSNITATIGYSVSGSTTTDQTAANFSTKSWTGQVNVSSTIPITTTWQRYSVVAAIPTTATQVGVSICYTPVGTAGATDWFEIAKAQLDVNPNAVALSPNTTPATGSALSFEHTSYLQEQQLQYEYFYELAESAAITPVASCASSTTSLDLCLVQFPTTMRAAPVFSGDGGFTTGFAGTTTSAMTAVSACTSLALSTSVTSTVANTQNALIACGSSAAFPAAGTPGYLYSNNASGVIKASAEL